MAKKVAESSSENESLAENKAQQTQSVEKSNKASCKRMSPLTINIIIGAVGLVLAGVMFLCGCLFGARNGRIGETGKNGATWYSGTEVPSSKDASFGVVGDFYFDEDNYDIYKLTNNGWVFVTNIKGANGQNGENGVGFYIGYDGYIWNGAERTEQYVETANDPAVLENTAGVKDTMSRYFDGRFVDLSQNRIALMNSYNATYNVTKFGSSTITEISIYAENDGELFIGTAGVADVVAARTSDSNNTLSTVFGNKYTVTKGYNKIAVNISVSSQSTLVIGGDGSVGVFILSGIPVNDEAGNFTIIDGMAHSEELLSLQNGYADTILIKVMQEYVPPVEEP